MPIARQKLMLASLSVSALASMAAGQVSGTWTGMGDGRTYSDPANWSSFPNVPGSGGRLRSSRRTAR